MRLSPRPILVLSIAFLVLVAVKVHAQDPAPPVEAVVFAPGAVSIDGGNVFRCDFSPDGREFWRRRFAIRRSST